MMTEGKIDVFSLLCINFIPSY